MRNKYKLTKVPYVWDSSGCGSELLLIEFFYKDCESTIDTIRRIVSNLEIIKEDLSYPNSIGGAFDCTGQKFGSDFRKLEFKENDGGFIVLMVHSWSMDI